jgi:hypothetical protein
VGVLCGTATALHLSAIATDRYLAIVHPVRHRNLGPGYVRTTLAVTWSLSVTIMTLQLVMEDTIRYWHDEKKGSQQCDLAQVQLRGQEV